jgi:hypothetical protein
MSHSEFDILLSIDSRDYNNIKGRLISYSYDPGDYFNSPSDEIELEFYIYAEYYDGEKIKIELDSDPIYDLLYTAVLDNPEKYIIGD